MKNKASKRKKKESTPKRRSLPSSKYPNPSAGKISNRRSNYPPSDAGDSVGYEEEYYDVSNIDESMAYIGFKALAATKIVLLLYSLISCFHLQVTGTGLSWHRSVRVPTFVRDQVSIIKVEVSVHFDLYLSSI